MDLFCIQNDFLIKTAGRLMVLVDIQTGVNYLYTGQGGICPRYNSDGTLMVDSKQAVNKLVEKNLHGKENYI